MEIFSLFGTILIKTSDAINSISKVADTAADMTMKIADSVENAGKKITSFGTKLSAEVTAPIVALGATAVKTFSTFEESMANVQAVTGASSETMEKLEEKARSMAKETVYSASECADALYYMGLAGWNAEEMTDGLPAVLNLAAAAQMDLGKASDIVTDYLTAFGLKATDASGFVDQLAFAMSNSNTDVEQLGEAYKNVAATSTQLGYSLEDTTAALMVMADSGIKGGEAGTALASIMTRLGNDVSGCRGQLELYGVEVYDSQGNVKSLSSILSGMQSVWRGLTDEEKSNLSYTVAGKTAQAELMTVMGESTGAFEQYRQGLLGCNDAAKEMVEIQNETLSAQLKILKSRFEEMCITIGERLAPYIGKLADKIGELCDWISSLSDEQVDQIIKWAAIVAAIGPVLVIVGKVITLIGTVISVGGKLISGIGAVISIIGKMSTVFTALGTIFSTIGTFISSTLIPVIAGIGAPVLAVIAVVTALIAIGVALYKNWDTIKEKCGQLKEFISEKWEGIKNAVSEKVETMKASVSEKMESMKEAVSEKMESMKSNMGTVLEAAKSTVQEKLNNMKKAYEDHGGGIKGAAYAAIEGVKGYYTAGYTFIDKLTGGKLSDIANKFKNKMDDIKNSVQNGIEKIKGFFKFDWELPKIKLPHFKINGKFSLNPPKAPSFDIEWYKKAMDEPIIMNQPTAFGINRNGQIMAGGEAGSEVVSGKDTLMSMISEAVSSQNERLVDILELILALIAQYMPKLANMQLVTDTGVLVGELVPLIDEQIGLIARRKQRG